MVKRGKGKSKRRHFFKRLHRPRDKRIPLLVTIPAVTKTIIEPLLGNPRKGFEGAWNRAANGNYLGALQEFGDIMAINFTGFKPSTGEFFGIMNPLETYATLGLGWLGGKLATKFGANNAMKRVPLLGKYVKL